MDVGLVALAVGALLTAGIGASLLAGRLRLPGLVLVLVLGMVIGSDGLEWINFGDQRRDYDVAQNAAIMALALILYEGGLSSGWAEIRPVIGVSIALATRRHAAHGGITAVAARAAVHRAEHARGADPRLDRGRHRRRRRVRRAARLDAAAQDRAHARGRVRRQRPDRRAARARLHRGDQARRLRARSTRSGWPSSELAIGAAVGLAVGGLGVLRAAARDAARRPACTRWPRSRSPRMAYGGADTLHGIGLPRRLPRRAW